MKRVFAHITNKVITVKAADAVAATGETLVGTIDHDEVGSDDTIGHKGSHVIYHHIEQLMNKVKLFDHHLYRIVIA